MADARKFLGGRWLNSEDLGGVGKSVVVTIADVTEGEVTSDKNVVKRGWVLAFAGKDKSLFCNATNTNQMIDLFGDDTDEWIDKHIKLICVRVEFGGKKVPAIRIEPAPSIPRRGRVATPPPPPEPDESEAGETEELTADEIPFVWIWPLLIPLGGTLAILARTMPLLG